MPGACFSLVHAGQLLTLSGPLLPRRGPWASELSIIPDGAFAAVDGRIVWAGPTDSFTAEAPPAAGARVLDAKGSLVTPGFVDSHTHALFAGSRAEEFARRAAGQSYQQIAASGGGIAATMRATRSAGRDALAASLRRNLLAMLGNGTTTAEVKSGYGLDLETEMLSLEVLAEVGETVPLTTVATFLGPHAVPPEYAGRPDDYIDFVIREVLPAVVSRNLATFADVFCEEGVFDIAQSRRYLEAAKGLGLGLKVHADEFADIGASRLAVELGASSADHLLATSPESASILASSGTVATLLPCTAFFLGKPFPDGAGLLSEGAAVAVATDFNPGSCYCESMPLALTTAVCRCGLTVEQAIVAGTANGAASLGLAGRKGCLQAGSDADFVVWDLDDYRGIPYHMGMPDISRVFSGAREALPVARTSPGAGHG
jgi:imidazolonepropionase